MEWLGTLFELPPGRENVQSGNWAIRTKNGIQRMPNTFRSWVFDRCSGTYPRIHVQSQCDTDQNYDSFIELRRIGGQRQYDATLYRKTVR
jgi:hypothetical protein